MADLGTHFSIGDTILIPAQTKNTSGTPTDADSLPTYQIYEQGGTTAITSGSFAKRDDANTTGYYEASVSLTTANGFEDGKQYVVRKLATVGGQGGIALDTFAITNAGAGIFNPLTAWFTIADVEEVVAAAGLELSDSVTDDYIQLKINAVVQEIGRRTRRQFVADEEDTTHYFDGSGTGLLEIDEMISLTSVEFIGFSNTPPLMEVDGVYLADDTVFPRNRLLIRQGSPFWYWANRFPQGRRNIAVTGIFGFASSIPLDLWSAGAEEVASRLGAEGQFTQAGRLSEWAEADVREKYDIKTITEALPWHKHFEDAVTGYTRPAGRVFRALRRTMV
jgi:hypothetical protein